jgi:hypothetical protein
MLTLKPAMNHLGMPPDPFSASRNLIRQPSAEDLDAAHQLVSSARGSFGSNERRQSIDNRRGAFFEKGSVEEVTSQSATSEQPALSGQVCR